MLFAFTLIAWLVLGPAPFLAFFNYHLPRLASGEAFAFGEVWPEIRDLIIADNQGAFGLIEKLVAMGVPGLDRASAAWFARLFGLGVLALSALYARREVGAPRHLRAAGWLAILGLGSMASTGAFGDYVPLTATWMITLVALRMRQGWRLALPLASCGFLQYFLVGTSPIGSWFSPAIMIPLSAVSALMMLATSVWVLFMPPARHRAWSLEMTHEEIMADLDSGFAHWRPRETEVTEKAA